MTQHFESHIAYQFRDKRLLDIALSHPSQKTYATDYQRFEFLGDSLLSAFISKYLFTHYPDATEGDMNMMRTKIVSGSSLSKKAKALQLDGVIKLSPGFKKNFGTPSDNMLEDTFEALIAAIYLDSDLDRLEAWLLETFKAELQSASTHSVYDNPKGALQEWSQLKKEGEIPRYELIEDRGPDHEKQYTVEVSVAGTILGTGTSTSIKQAEILAALNALKNFKA